MCIAYLGHIFDQSDSQFNIGEIVEVIQPGDLFGYSKKQTDQGKCPANQQQYQGRPGDLLTPSLEEIQYTLIYTKILCIMVSHSNDMVI